MNKKVVIIIVSVVGVLFLLCGCCTAFVLVSPGLISNRVENRNSSVTLTPKADDEFVRDSVVFENSRISFNYPKTWNKETATSPYIVLSISADEINGAIPANFNVVTEDLSGSGVSTAARYYDLNYENIVNEYPDIDFVSKRVETTIDGNKAYSHVMNSMNSAGKPIKQLQIITVYGDKGWVFTFTSTPEDFSEYNRTIDKILSTVEFK